MQLHNIRLKIRKQFFFINDFTPVPGPDKKSEKKCQPFLAEVVMYQSSYEPLFMERKKTGGVRSLEESRKPKTLLIRSNNVSKQCCSLMYYIHILQQQTFVRSINAFSFLVVNKTTLCIQQLYITQQYRLDSSKAQGEHSQQFPIFNVLGTVHKRGNLTDRQFLLRFSISSYFFSSVCCKFNAVFLRWWLAHS